MPFISSIRRNYEQEKRENKTQDFEITGGDLVYTAGGYRIHTFTTTGEAELFVKNLQNTNTNTMNLYSGINAEVLAVAGGGGAGSIGGGGGAGGVVQSNTVNLMSGSTPVTVGAGGNSGGTYPGPNGNPGGNSAFGNYIALGGAGSTSWNNRAQRPGGCGAGGPGSPGSGIAGGLATQPGQPLPNGAFGTGFPGARGGNNPGSHYPTGAGTYTGGGGGGAGSAGGASDGAYNALNDTRTLNWRAGRKGGNGVSSNISGQIKVYAGGGGGSMHQSSGYNSPVMKAKGGLGGGGRGSSWDIQFGPNGRGEDSVTNTGGGGGGGNYTGRGTGDGGNGGPGIVIVRYLV